MTKEEVLNEMTTVFPFKAIKLSEDLWYDDTEGDIYIRYGVWIQDRWTNYSDSLDEMINDFRTEFPPKNEILFRKFEL